MSRTHWKHREREAAALVHGARYPANTGAAVDVESGAYCVQVKERQTLSLAQLERLVLEIDRVAQTRTKLGVVMVKRSAGRGRITPWLVIVSEGTWRELNGRLPTDPASEGGCDDDR